MSLFTSSSHTLAAIRSKRGRNAGLSLVEVMVASVLLTMAGICFIAALTQAYRMASLIRYENQARYILRSVADQFLIAGTTNPMLAPASAYTGVGLAWDGDLQIFCYETDAIARDNPAVDSIGNANGLVLKLGNIRVQSTSAAVDASGAPTGATSSTATIQGSAPLTATITRRVSLNTAATAIGAGVIYQADFKAKFRFLNKDRELVTTVVRTIP